MKPVRFVEATDEGRFGGKSVSLGAALRAGLPAPDGYALDVSLVEAVTRGDAAAVAGLEPVFDELGPTVAVRSSAVGEDSERASFAGQHLTVLNVHSPAAMVEAVGQVHASAHTESALAYRKKLGVDGGPKIAVAVQRLVQSDSAGVLFTKNPMSGASERTIEAAWGLGEAIVSGLVVPDSFRIHGNGEILERTAGEKDLMLVSRQGGGTQELEVEPDRIEALCLDDSQLGALHQLALDCEAAYGRDLDIEWAFAGGSLYLLQCRAITR